MPDALPTTLMPSRATGRDAETIALWLRTAILEENGLAAALDVLMQALGGVAAEVRRVPVAGPVGDDRGVITSRAVEPDESLALALWWISAEGCVALGRLSGGGIVEHGRARRTPPALRHAITMLVEVERQGFCAVTLWRQPGTRGLMPRQVALLDHLAPHLAGAIAVELGRASAALRAALVEDQGEAVLLLDADQRVLSVSQGMRDLLAHGDGLRLSERGLSAQEPAEQTRLTALIQAALRPGDGITRDGRIAISRPGAGAPWLVEARSLRRRGAVGVALIVSAPRPRPGPSEAALRDIFGLTPSEIALAVSLSGGMALTEHGRRRRIAMPTVRSHLSRLLVKLNCSRQAEAIARLNALAG